MYWLGSKFLVFTETHKLEVITSTFILHKKMMVQSKFLLKFHLTHSDAVPVILFVQKNSNPIELMQIPPKEEPVVPAAIEPEHIDAALRDHIYQQSKKKWWRCENPGCTFATKNKYSQRKGNSGILWTSPDSNSWCLVPGSTQKLSVFKWHPLYECQHVPVRTEEDRKLQEEVKKLKLEGRRIKKEKDKERMKFECPYVDPVTSQPCGRTYATYRYSGALKHLRTCSLRAAPGNAERMREYIKLKKINLSTW